MVPVWKTQFLKRLNVNLFYDLAIPFPHIYPKEITHIHKRMTSYNNQKVKPTQISIRKTFSHKGILFK